MHIVNSVLGEASGGRWQVVCDYSRLLVDHGHRVLLLLGRRHLPDAGPLPSGVEVRIVDNRGHYDYPAAWRLRRGLSVFRPRIALAHCSRSVALLRRALPSGTPLLAVSHSAKVKRLVPADACVALNRAIRKRFERISGGKPCYVVPNGIPVDASRPPGPQQSGRLPKIAALGRFDAVKGFDIFVEALGMLGREGRNFRAVLGGAGARQQALENRVAALGLSQRVTFPGWVTDVDNFFATADVLCVPARSDAFGLTPLQAAAAGVPLVLSTAEGHRDMFVPEVEALYAEVGDIGRTAAQIARILDDPGLAERLRQAAFRKVASHYSTAAVGEKVIEAIENTIVSI
ncbi:MAG: glycosyltransferase family 4 protein [Thiogranum sp.]